MATIRFRIKVNPGRRGAPLKKLAQIYDDLGSFLSSAAGDIGVPVGSFLLCDFQNSSVEATVEAEVDSDESAVHEYTAEIRNLIKFQGHAQKWRGRLKPKTLKHYVAIGSHLDYDEHIEFGFAANEPAWSWERIEKEQTKTVSDTLQELLEYVGAIIGLPHTWYKESDEPHFNVRDIETDVLIPCYYRPEHHASVVSLFEKQRAMAHISGVVTANSLDGTIERINLEQCEPIDSFTNEQLNLLTQNSIDVTDGRESAEYIRSIRDRE